MPEGPELRLAANFVNKVAAQHRFYGKITKSELATKPTHHPEVLFDAKSYSVFAESRGKELKLHLYEEDEKKKSKKNLVKQNSQEVKHLLFRFGMSGSFKLSSVDDIPKHAHLRFWSQDKKHLLCFVDYRRFGAWMINGDWGADRGPDSVTEYPEFRSNILQHLDNTVFNKPICEVLLNQKYFNGIGNYLRAEILYRLEIPPFAKARDVLESLEVDQKLTENGENADIIELCNIIPNEVLGLGHGKGYDVDKGLMMDMDAFNNWLQCYYQDGMNNLVDHNGRTIWFKGPAGPLKPTTGRFAGKSRGMKTKRKSKTEDKDVHCVSGNLDQESEENPKSKTKKKKTTKEIIKKEHDYTNGKKIKQEIKREIKQEVKIESVDNDETENRISIKKEIIKQEHDYTNGKNSNSSQKTNGRKKKPFEYEEQNGKTKSARTSRRTRKSVDYSEEK